MIDQILTFLRVVVPTQIERILLAIGATIGGWIALGLGGFDDAIKILSAFVLTDIITGACAAWKQGKWNSRAMYRGLFKKAFIYVIVMIANGVDNGLHLNFMREACVMAYIVNEAGSVLENLDRMGYGHLIPAFLRRGIEQLKEQKKAQYEGKLGIREGEDSSNE